MSNPHLLAVVNAILCLAIMGICICRLRLINKQVRLRVGVQYVVLLMAAAGLLLSPFLWEYPGWGTAAFVGAVLFMLCADSYQWQHGAPSSTTGPQPQPELTYPPLDSELRHSSWQ